MTVNLPQALAGGDFVGLCQPSLGVCVWVALLRIEKSP